MAEVRYENEELAQQVREGKIGLYFCDSSCGLSFLLPKDENDFVCYQCHMSPVYVRDAELSDLRVKK